jgi:hypothetical protein
MEWDLCFIPLHFIPLHYVPFRSAPLSSINPNITKNKMNLPSFTSKSLVSTSHNFVYVPECKFASQMILILSRVSTSSIPFWLLILSLSCSSSIPFRFSFSLVFYLKCWIHTGKCRRREITCTISQRFHARNPIQSNQSTSL